MSPEFKLFDDKDNGGLISNSTLTAHACNIFSTPLKLFQLETLFVKNKLFKVLVTSTSFTLATTVLLSPQVYFGLVFPKRDRRVFCWFKLRFCISIVVLCMLQGDDF